MAKKYEKSSGWIVYRKNGNKVEVLLLKWLNSKDQEVYVIPKWHIEDWEVAKDAAVREISEEAGLLIEDLEVIKFITKLNYTFTAWYLKNTPVIDKDVYLFLVKYNWTKAPVVEKEERFVWYDWFSLEEIKKIKVMFDLQAIIWRNKTFFI
jgi:predicted NUDIX family NTP pyrophosphohydrolase